jgi:hypothetical protein
VARDKLVSKILSELSRFADGQKPVDLVDRLRGY